MTKPGRIPCEVLGCRRTAPAAKFEPHTRICCGKCWRLGSTAGKAAYRVARREVDRLSTAGAQPALIDAAHAAVNAAFWAIVRTASEARAGIG